MRQERPLQWPRQCRQVPARASVLPATSDARPRKPRRPTGKPQQAEGNAQTAPFLARIRAKLRHGLLVQGILGRLGRLGVRVRPYIVYREDASLHRDMPALPGSFSVRELSSCDIAALDAMPGHDMPPGTYQERFDVGDVAVGVFDGEQLVSFTWASTRFLGLQGSPPIRELDTGEAFVYDAFTHAAYRGRGLVSASVGVLKRVLVNRGCSRAYSATTVFNGSARRMRNKVGSQAMQCRLSISLFGRFHRDFALGKAGSGAD